MKILPNRRSVSSWSYNRKSSLRRRADDTEGLDPDDYAEGGDIPEEDDSFPEDDVDADDWRQRDSVRGDESGFVERPPSQVSDEESVADDKVYGSQRRRHGPQR